MHLMRIARPTSRRTINSAYSRVNLFSFRTAVQSSSADCTSHRIYCVIANSIRTASATSLGPFVILLSRCILSSRVIRIRCRACTAIKVAAVPRPFHHYILFFICMFSSVSNPLIIARPAVLYVVFCCLLRLTTTRSRCLRSAVARCQPPSVFWS